MLSRENALQQFFADDRPLLLFPVYELDRRQDAALTEAEELSSDSREELPRSRARAPRRTSGMRSPPRRSRRTTPVTAPRTPRRRPAATGSSRTSSARTATTSARSTRA